jgi:hypothetical protein
MKAVPLKNSIRAPDIYGFIAEYHVHRSGCTAWAWVNAEQDHWF